MSASVTVLVKMAVMPSLSSSTYFPRSSSLPAMALTHLLQCTNGGHYRAARQAWARRAKGPDEALRAVIDRPPKPLQTPAMPELITRGRACAIIRQADRILLNRFGGDSFWALPGGAIESGEFSTDALVREMREELGVTVEIGRLIWVVENQDQFFRGVRYDEIAALDFRPTVLRLPLLAHLSGAQRATPLHLLHKDR